MKKRYYLFFLFALVFSIAFSQIVNDDVWVSEMLYHGQTEKLIEADPTAFKLSSHAVRKKRMTEVPNFVDMRPMPIVKENALPQEGDPLRQQSLRMDFALDPYVNVDGMGYNGVFPPDPVGAVGMEYYISMINDPQGASISIISKDGTDIFGPFISNVVFWDPFGFTGVGDPIIFYDQEAKRWVLTEFTLQNQMLIAVSVDESPLGSWNIYSIQAPSFPDYPKFGKWNNSYFVTTNEPGDENVPIYLIEREALITGGSAAQMARVGIPKFIVDDFVFQVASPVDWIGDAAPDADEPFKVVRMRDDAWGDWSDAIEMWEVSIDWSSPEDVQVTGPIELELSPFDASLCEEGLFDCILNPNGQEQSVVAQVIMHRPVYRRFEQHESIVLNFSVDVDPSRNISGIRWVEIRRDSVDWYVYQEGTYSPDDDHRFMGSSSMDSEGNIMLGYTVLGNQTFPGLRYTGRRSDDPLGIMTMDEGTIIDGAASNNSVRWGDYSAMTVDPSDGRSFWYIGEYMKNVLNWGTRIASFYFPEMEGDMAPLSISSPTSLTNLSSETEISVVVRNLGLEALPTFEVETTIDDFVLDTVINDTLFPGEIQEITYIQRLDLTGLDSLTMRVVTSALGDDIVENDTIMSGIRIEPTLDASILNTKDLTETSCQEAEKRFMVVVGNTGFGILESFELVAVLNDGEEFIETYNGALQPYSSEEIEMTLTNLDSGRNEVLIYVRNPNGQDDQDNSRDTIRESFENIESDYFVNLLIDPDNFPNETSWVLEDTAGNVIAEKRLTPSDIDVQDEMICLESGCYTFIIRDDMGDGICCGFGEGSYVLTDQDGNFLARGGMFTFEDSTDFCIPFSCNLTADIQINEPTDGEDNGAIFIEVMNDVEPVEYSIDGGENFQQSPVFLGLEGDRTYFVVIRDLNECIYEDTVQLGMITSSQNPEYYSTSLTLYPNPTQGDFYIEFDVPESPLTLPFRIYSSSGQLVTRADLHRWNDVLVYKESILGRTPGEYFVVIEYKNRRIMKKIILQP